MGNPPGQRFPIATILLAGLGGWISLSSGGGLWTAFLVGTGVGMLGALGEFFIARNRMRAKRAAARSCPTCRRDRDESAQGACPACGSDPSSPTV